MTKTKLLMPLAVILAMGMATSAFAQMSCNVASTPVSRATATGHTEQAGDLIFNCSAVGAAPTLPATMTLSYGGVIITNTAAFPAGRPIDVTSVTPGSFTGGPPDIPNDNSTVSNATGQVVVNIPGQPAGSPAGSFSVTGVLVSLNGTNLNSLDVSVSVSQGTGVLITAGQNNATVITSIQQGINTTTAPPAILAGTQAALYFGTPPAATPTTLAPVVGRAAFTIVVQENYIDMLREGAQYAGSTPAGQDTNLAFTFTGIATGTTIGPCTALLHNTNTLVQTALTVSGGGLLTSTTTGGAPGPTMTVSIPGGVLTDLSQIEQVRLTCAGITINATTTPQPLSTPITATVTLATTGSALSSATPPAPIVTGAGAVVPRYQSTPISIGTVLAFTPNTTTMIIPFALGDPSTTAPAGTFDTGVAIANTTGETVGGTGVFATGGAVAQAGTVTFHFFPSSGIAADRFSVTTASVASGASYVANVSEILRAGGRTASFSGYIIAVANFTNAHGMAFLYGGSAASRITSATDVLTIQPPAVSGRGTFGLTPGVEATWK
jgi:hypothetical protein